jgi:hypothetical protein
MAAVIKGTGVCWSVGAIAFTAGIVSGTNGNFTQSTSLQRTSEKNNVKDNGGTVKTQVFHGFMKSLSITVVPNGSSIANANTSADAYLPAPGTKISITDDSGTIMDDNYNLLSSKENRTVDGVRTIDLELEAGDEGVELATDPIA